MSVDAAGGAYSPQPGPAVAILGPAPDWRELVRFLPDLGQLLADVARDPRVPLRAKLIAGAVGLYLVSPVDLVPGRVAWLGRMDDLAWLMWGLSRLLRAAGYEVLRDLWQGSEEGFLMLMVVAGVER